MTNKLKLVGNNEPHAESRIEIEKTFMFEYKGQEHTIAIRRIGEELILGVNDGGFVLMSEKQFEFLAHMISQCI